MSRYVSTVDCLVKSLLTFFRFFSSKDVTMEEKDEQKEFETGPLSVLMQSVKQNTQVKRQEILYSII
jgi:hypothetical protein